VNEAVGRGQALATNSSPLTIHRFRTRVHVAERSASKPA
jgi:hypothetical protein